jgi:hypothetical protein
LKKKQGKKKSGATWLTRRVDPVKPDQDPVANPLTFFFFLLKQCRFDLKKKNCPANLVTRSRPGDPVKTWNLGLGPGRPLDRVLKVSSQGLPYSRPLA